MRAVACILSLSLMCFSATALAGDQILTTTYELFVPDGVERVQDDDQYDAVVASLKADIQYIVHNAAQLQGFPLSPELVLPLVVFQKPVTHLKLNGADIFAFTVDVPVPDVARDILLATFFSSDVKTPSNKGYYLRLHKERAYIGDADVGIIIVRAAAQESLYSPEIDTIIRSFSTYE